MTLEERIKALEDRVYVHLRVPSSMGLGDGRMCGAKHGRSKEMEYELSCPQCLAFFAKHKAEIMAAWNAYWATCGDVP